jgi:hypothetical protein
MDMVAERLSRRPRLVARSGRGRLITRPLTNLLLVLGVVLGTADTSRADIGVLVLEPVSALGLFTRVGHAGVYLSNICPDGSPVRMRLCRSGEHGSVLSKYSPLSDNEDYDWAIVPFDVFLHGVTVPALAPMIATQGLQQAIERAAFGPLFSSALTTTPSGALPGGQWPRALAARFHRTLYLFSVSTEPDEDAVIVAAFNEAPNTSRFNFFYRNCSDQVRELFDLSLAKALVDRAVEPPGLRLHARRFAQLPGTFSRSKSVLFPMENAYRNVTLAPWWFFGGFREVALGSIVYHQVVSPFSLMGAVRDFISPAAATLTLEQHRRRQQQDILRAALSSAQNRGADTRTLAAQSVRTAQRLDTLRRAKRAEVNQVEGTRAQWRTLEAEFRSARRTVDWGRFAPPSLVDALARPQDGRLSRLLLRHFERHGTFSVEPGERGPWLALPLADGAMHATGLSLSHVLTGDPRVAVLVLTAVLDDSLHQAEARSRPDIAYVDAVFSLFRQASDAIRREAESAHVTRTPN